MVMNKTRIKRCAILQLSWNQCLIKQFQNLISIILLTLLSGCRVGPDFVRPPPPESTSYTKAKVASHLVPGNGEPSQHLILGKEVPAAWWQLFHSPSLNQVIQQAIANSPTIEAARAKLAQAQQSILMARGSFYPQIDGSGSAQREKGPPLAFGLLSAVPATTIKGVPTYNLYSFGPTVNFVPDVFGLTSRRVEQQTALAENQAYQLAAAQLSVTGNIVAQALTIASIRLQIKALEKIIADDEKSLELMQKRLVVGLVNRTDFLLAQNQLEKDRSNLPQLKQQLDAAEHALTILVGKSPAEWSPPAFSMDEFTLPKNLPLVFPSMLVSQRPDIMAAEAELHASSAAIGIAKAQLFPTITLSASVDPTALTPANLFNSSNLAWDIFSGVATPIFHGGTLQAQKRAAIDAFQTSLAMYKQTVLEGLRQVADKLRALSHDAELVQADRRSLDTLKASVTLQRQRFTVGTVDLLDLLNADRTYQQARISYAQSQSQRYLDSAQLLVALGGGWNKKLA